MSSNFPPAAKRVAIVANTTLRCAHIGAETPSNRTAGGDDRSGFNAFRDFDEILSDYIMLIAERDDGHSGSPHESRMATCCQRAGDIPP
jgi:hypothetical protein